MVDPLIMEVAKVLIQGAFNYARVNGLSDEEINSVYEKEREQFFKNDPFQLPDPPA